MNLFFVFPYGVIIIVLLLLPGFAWQVFEFRFELLLSVNVKFVEIITQSYFLECQKGSEKEK